MSTFAWLDFSERERRRMLDVVDLFRERETQDELGIGTVRDALADLFFPGTSTIMTRARYFLIVPWTYLRLEAKQVGSAEVGERARRNETDLIEVIAQSDDSEGNIGRIAKRALKRLPSSAYWAGLATWGIRNFAGAQAQYHRSLDSYYLATEGHSRRARERDLESDDTIMPNWHGGIIKAPKEFPNECSLALTRREAEYLAERIRLAPGTAKSLLAEFLARDTPPSDADFAWEDPIVAGLAERFGGPLTHAQNFSELMHGAALLYNLMLSELRDSDELVETYRAGMASWAEKLENRSSHLAAWRWPDFLDLVLGMNPRISQPTRRFIEAWRDLVIGGNPRKIGEAHRARTLIHERERRLKHKLARLDNVRAREVWGGRSGSAQLDFRWWIARDLLRDIFDGLGRADA
jgi:Family of unknown function (DUF6361)